MTGRDAAHPADFDLVTVRSVSRYYGRRRALSRVSTDFKAGAIAGLFGPNGAGKSTLLGVLATLVAPTQGEVRYGQATAAEWGDPLRRHIGVLGHDLFLYADLTARENLEFFGQLHGVTNLGTRVEAALGAARLTDRGGDRVSGFSRGLRQRLALERALLHGPRLVLLDEPFTGLDDSSSDDHRRWRRDLAGSVSPDHPCGGVGMSVLRAAWLIARKDLRIEVRSKELVYTTLFFAFACVLVFSFAFVRADGVPVDNAAAGILWVAIAFSGTLALGRTFERERQAETLRALLLAPVERAAIYLGKLFAVLTLLLSIGGLLIPVTGLLFQAPIGRAPWLLCALVAAGTIGFAVVGTLFAAMLVRASSRDVLLPVVLYPLTVPVIIAGVRGTAAIFAPEPDLAMAETWLAMLVFFDVVFLTLALWTFAPVMRD
jgi:heme exporter protein B